MKWILISIILISVVLLYSFVRAQVGGERYAIQNVENGKNLRPFAAGSQDGNKIILYDAHRWKCMTWDFVKADSTSFQLKNRWTGKTFQPSESPNGAVTLSQQPLFATKEQHWNFIKVKENTYLIQLQHTDLYITSTSNATNSKVVLKPLQHNETQLWKLIKQNPLF